MAETMNDDRLQAGADYGDALRRLGFTPEGLLWCSHQTTQQLQLAIVTGLVDRVGSLDIYKVLFDAYDRAGTPKTIDPFIVSLYSPKSNFAIQFKQGEQTTIGKMIVKGFTLDGADFEQELTEEPWFFAGDYLYRKSWVYQPLIRKSRVETQDRQWSTLKHNVERLAA